MSSEPNAGSEASGRPPPMTASRAEFEAALYWGLERATERAARRLVWVDPDFATWPLDDVAWHQRLSAWLHLPLRRLVLLAHDYTRVPVQHPRFVAWRRDWSHAIEALSPPADLEIALPTLLLDDGPISVHLIDRVHWRMRASADPRDAHRWRSEIDAVLQRSEPAFPVHPLGL